MDARHRIVIVTRTSLGNFKIDLKQPAEPSILDFQDEKTVVITAEEAKAIASFITEIIGDSIFTRIIGDPNYPQRFTTHGE